MHATTRHLHHHRPHRWRRWRMAGAAAAALASTLVAAQLSTATTSRVTAQPTYTTVVTDPNDTDGPLDLARVKHRVRVLDRQQARVRYTVETYSPYAARRLDVRNRNFVLELNRDSHPGSERNVRVAYVSGSLVGEVISNATRKTLATVAVQRIDARTIRIHGPRDLIGARSYFWTSTFHARRSRACGFSDGYPITCQDVVPESGWIRMDRPAWPTGA